MVHDNYFQAQWKWTWGQIEFNWQEVEKKGLNNGQKLLQKRNKTEEPSSLKALQSSKNF